MKLELNETDYEQITSRLDAEDGKHYMGIFNVIFGRRIRAGRYGNFYVDIDWCCGSDTMLLMKTYEALKKHLERSKNGENPFKGLPSCSKIKPINRDQEFMEMVSNVIPEMSHIKIIK